jgi:RNA polymerase sigma-70 factor (ECF subfamily)
MIVERPTYRPGDRDDFDRLYRDSYARVLYTLLGILRDRPAAEDCAQEAFARAFAAWPGYRPEAPAEAWVHRIALNVAVSHERRARVRRGEAPKIPVDHEPEEAAELLHALRRLPPRDAAIIVLRHHHGYANREIAQALGVPESTIASRLATAKRRLRTELRWDQVR